MTIWSLSKFSFFNGYFSIFESLLKYLSAICYFLALMELIPSVELVPKVNQITHRIELELELIPKNHENPSPDSDPALELIQPYHLPTPISEKETELVPRPSLLSLSLSWQPFKLQPSQLPTPYFTPRQSISHFPLPPTGQGVSTLGWVRPSQMFPAGNFVNK